MRGSCEVMAAPRTFSLRDGNLAFRNGATAFRAGRCEAAANPYRAGSASRDDFTFGYYTAISLRRDPGL